MLTINRQNRIEINPGALIDTAVCMERTFAEAKVRKNVKGQGPAEIRVGIFGKVPVGHLGYDSLKRKLLLTKSMIAKRCAVRVGKGNADIARPACALRVQRGRAYRAGFSPLSASEAVVNYFL